MLRFISVLFFLLVSTFGQAAPTIFYGMAHEDDWQLFMMPDAYYNTNNSGKKIVFVYLTAGDGGLGSGNFAGVSIPYYLAREKAAQVASNYIADVNQWGSTAATTTVTINNHSLKRIAYKNTVSYFFRLPDGNVDGNGFPVNNFASLAKFRQGLITSLTALDNSVVFSSWSDLTNTLSALIKLEANPNELVSVSIPDTNTALNPNDHSDHLTTSYAFQDAIQFFPCINKNFYVDYYSNTMQTNVSGYALYVDMGTWGATTAALTSNLSFSTMDSGHLSWIGRNYYRSVNSGIACNL